MTPSKRTSDALLPFQILVAGLLGLVLVWLAIALLVVLRLGWPHR